MLALREFVMVGEAGFSTLRAERVNLLYARDNCASVLSLVGL